MFKPINQSIASFIPQRHKIANVTVQESKFERFKNSFTRIVKSSAKVKGSITLNIQMQKDG